MILLLWGPHTFHIFGPIETIAGKRANLLLAKATLR